MSQYSAQYEVFKLLFFCNEMGIKTNKQLFSRSSWCNKKHLILTNCCLTVENEPNIICSVHRPYDPWDMEMLWYLSCSVCVSYPMVAAVSIFFKDNLHNNDINDDIASYGCLYRTLCKILPNPPKGLCDNSWLLMCISLRLVHPPFAPWLRNPGCRPHREWPGTKPADVEQTPLPETGGCSICLDPCSLQTIPTHQ